MLPDVCCSYVFPGCLTPAGIAQLEADMAATLQTKAWGFGSLDDDAAPGSSDTFGMSERSMLVRGPVADAPELGVSAWPAPGTASFQLIDDAFVVACLELAIGAPFHFCHCAYGYRTPGAGGMGFHQGERRPACAAARNPALTALLAGQIITTGTTSTP